jgi:hypothetical protein
MHPVVDLVMPAVSYAPVAGKPTPPSSCGSVLQFVCGLIVVGGIIAFAALVVLPHTKTSRVVEDVPVTTEPTGLVFRTSFGAPLVQVNSTSGKVEYYRMRISEGIVLERDQRRSNQDTMCAGLMSSTAPRPKSVYN